VSKTFANRYFFRTFETQIYIIFMRIQIINGPNLNLLGVREPEIYGRHGFEEYLQVLRDTFSGVQLDYYQSNVEGELINKIHEVGFDYDGIVLNAGAYTHYSIALLDAIKGVSTPVIEVHISNVHKREEFRHHSVISSACLGVICGFGLDSYRLAVDALLHKK
jgi:3-dehydroquinate dehydratase-2